MCHFPVSARALAVARPSPEEAPVIITFPFLNVLFPSSGAWLISETVAVWALTAPTGSLPCYMLMDNLYCKHFYYLGGGLNHRIEYGHITLFLNMRDFDFTSISTENGTPERPVSFRTTVPAAYTSL